MSLSDKVYNMANNRIEPYIFYQVPYMALHLDIPFNPIFPVWQTLVKDFKNEKAPFTN